LIEERPSEIVEAIWIVEVVWIAEPASGVRIGIKNNLGIADLGI
jgi:hypothetical protein